mgnify:CR=1 FL=1
MKLSLLGLAMGLVSKAAVAATSAPPLENKQAFIDHLISQMTEAEKIGQLRLISISPEMPREKIREEIKTISDAAGALQPAFVVPMLGYVGLTIFAVDCIRTKAKTEVTTTASH